jgi:hypothetical protein
MWEHAAVGEPGDLGDPAAGEGEHEQPDWTGDAGVGRREVTAEPGLAVRTRRDEPERRPAAGSAVREEAPDRRRSLILEGLGRHLQPRVAGQERDDRVDMWWTRSRSSSRNWTERSSLPMRLVDTKAIGDGLVLLSYKFLASRRAVEMPTSRR